MMPLKLIGCVLPTNFGAPLLRRCSCDVLPGVAFGKGAFGIFSTVPVRISRRVDALKANPRSRFGAYNHRGRNNKDTRVLSNSGGTDERLIYLPPTG